MSEPTHPQTLVACIGNIFLGDDGFGSEVACALGSMQIPSDTEVIDFGIRGFDVAFALLKPYRTVVLVDAIAAGLRPGAVSVFQPVESDPASKDVLDFDPHTITPESVLRLARMLGEIAADIYIVGCEPKDFGDELEGRMGLSEVVRSVVPKAAQVVLGLVARLGRPRSELHPAA